MADRWLTCKDVAERLRVVPATVARYIKDGYGSGGPKLKATKFGSWRIWPDDLEAFERAVQVWDQSSETEPAA